MGSSKKHKEKDKDRDGKKHKHKDRDKDRDRDRKHRSKHRHRDRDRHAEKDAGQGLEAGELSSPEHQQKSDRKRRRTSPSPPHVRIKVEKDLEVKKNERQEEDDGGGGASGGGFSASLSIAETNKIRAKLGLAPLDVGTGGGDGEPGEIVEEKKDVHKPAINISEVKKSEALKEKMAIIREKRLINQRLHKVKTIADDDDDDDAAAWVERMRKKQIAKEEAAKRAKMLEEMDEEFGIGRIVEDEFGKSKTQDVYSSRHLGGFKVEHSKDKFREGQSVILTLKDMDALKEDEEEVLVNVNMVDNERAAKNVELRKKKPDYKPYEEDEFDEEGMFKHKSLLSKYDEEIEGEQKKSFRLNAGGGASLAHEDHMAKIRSELQRNKVSLDMRAPTLASEYYSVAEVEAFKKPKKKRRKLKAKSIADELVPEADTGRDHGSRGGMRRRIRDGDEDPMYGSGARTDGGHDAMDMDVDFPDADQAPIEFGYAREDDNIWGEVIEDEAEKELHNVLNKARRLKQKSKVSQKVEDQVARVVANIKTEPEMPMEEPSSSISIPTSSRGSNIVLNSTSEFCRTLGDIPSYGKSGLRDEDEENLMDFEKEEQGERMEDEDGEDAAGAWNTVNLDRDEAKKQEQEELGPVLDDEPTLQTGVAGALSLATKKGYLIKEEEKKPGAKYTTITAQNFTVEDKNFNDIDAKYNKHDRYRGPLMDFKEKSGYKPDVNITYTDETGRSLNQKEAFRVLSHRFHGKGSGKMKTEKRAKKILEEEAMKKMSSTDTPLNTVARMQEKQKNLQSAYIVLSGGSKTMTAHSITK
ncbi:U4/U6.U5 tri-snRNP-associated protein 1-like [Diadema antillarum]|uniref:U4/U6.U5 tri-snRNP-associated protein 1-like n=1 Tax=Diadema antillarum TaxID=105358 RepID=UPI003A83A3AC